MAEASRDIIMDSRKSATAQTYLMISTIYYTCILNLLRWIGGVKERRRESAGLLNEEE